MNEMIANKKFLSLEFVEAIKIYEQLLTNSESEYKDFFPKLVICYVAVGKIEKSLNLLEKVLKNNPETIIFNENLKNGLCPCYEIIAKIETKRIRYPDKLKELQALGILWLYCDMERALSYFNQYLIQKDNEVIKKIRELLNSLQLT